ncbi:conserved hypothetical protein [Aster yellows witches'-broom phytoplasma AYWB]|uniref:Uncharacterized protein n=1 Tax=Aster yellows witches'-broom phytoplasma (strain AYWB) TaxID=322098 RepID=Q2NJX0_AYWBP|nr:conserved hypothetical protein [Aster yellows witches'-broom phytoplasma AYWB]
MRIFLAKLKLSYNINIIFYFQNLLTKMKKSINYFLKFCNNQWILAKLNYSSPSQYCQNFR